MKRPCIGRSRVLWAEFTADEESTTAGNLEQKQLEKPSWDNGGTIEEDELEFQELLSFYGYQTSDPISDCERESQGSDTGHPCGIIDLEQEEEVASESEQMPHSTGCSSDWTSEPAVEEEEVMHGSQAQIPNLQCTPASGQNFTEQDQLLWDPNVLPEAEVENFLRGAAKYRHRNARELTRDRGIVKDDEQALYELQRCGFHTEEALRRLYFNVKAVKGGLCAWDEDELRKFEQGFRIYGKNFHLIQANKVQTRSVGECVQCYYSWKKSKRYKLFTQSRLGRRKLGNTASVECESDTLESNSLFGLQESAISSHQYTEASADGRNNKPHCDSSCMKDQCTCKVGTLSGPSFEDNQETSSLTGDLNTFDFSTQGLPLLSGLMGPDLPLTTFSKVDRALPDYLSAPSMLCTASMTH